MLKRLYESLQSQYKLFLKLFAYILNVNGWPKR